jgi:hypothetical protein
VSLKREPTIVEVLTKRLGPWKAGLVVTFIVLWWAEEERQGGSLEGVEDLVDSGHFSRAAAFRRQAEFRTAFEPWGLKNPHELAELLPQRTRSAVHTARLGLA